MSRDIMNKKRILSVPPLPHDLTYDAENEAELFNIPESLPLVPMMELNAFPRLACKITLEDTRIVDALRKNPKDQVLGLFALKTEPSDPFNMTKENFYDIGLAARVLAIEEPEVENDFLTVHILGLKRVSLKDLDSQAPSVTVEVKEEPETLDESIKPLEMEAKRLFSEILLLIPGGPPFSIFNVNKAMEGQPEILADLIMATIPLNPSSKALHFQIDDLKLRYHRLLEHLTMELASRKAGRAISARMESSLANRHKELHLREQLKAIKEELGEGQESDDITDIVLRLDDAGLPEAAREAADRDVKRLRLTPPQSAEYSQIRNYLEWMCELPWSQASQSVVDLAKAREILDRDHRGLEKVKKRVLEFLAVHKLTNNLKAPILCLTGPPGVGKTSLGKAIAEALGREFHRLSLGGIRDEAEIRGHRRTYVGANPGRIISGLRKIKTNNPVFLLDEIDKMGQSIHGDPGSALLEALDPEQNSTFTDNFLEVPFDLSNVLFILTANVLEHIPAPLRDRLEIIEVSGYTVEEKVDIAKRHLWAKELARHGLEPDEVHIAPEEIQEVITAYTWEAGCRDLSRKLGALARSRAMAKAEERGIPTLITRDEVRTVLGPPTRRPEDKREKEARIGVVTGLAWTAAGGDIMFIEGVAMPGKGHLSLTGQLGEVMKESAQAALCHVRSRSRDWFLHDSWFKENDIHIHLPHGAIPKDGPSAGVSLATAIVSLVSGQKVRPDVAMTGEITLRGLVLPIGGVKEKLLAAKRAGVTTVLIPEGNLSDLRELSPTAREGLTIIPVATMDDVLEHALAIPEDMLESGAFMTQNLEIQQHAWTAALKARQAKLGTQILTRDGLINPQTPTYNVA